LEEFEISDEFIAENKDNLGQFMPKSHKRGPYTKEEQNKRRTEVYRLHFDYGYSARKISEMMKVNRNTVNGDINYWYSKAVSSHNLLDPIDAITVNLQRLEIQRTRLRNNLDETNSFAEKIALERLLCDVDSKVMNTHHRLSESTKRMIDHSTIQINKFMEKNGKDTRYMALFDRIAVSENALKRINKIIKDDTIRNVL